MTEYILDDDYIEKIEAQVKLWANFLNTGVGLLAFTLAMASLGTESPVINSWLSFAVVVIVRVQGKNYFPAEIQMLKARAKSDSTAKILLDGLMSKYFGFGSNFRLYPLLVVGILLLWAVGVSPAIAKVFPQWGIYVGI